MRSRKSPQFIVRSTRSVLFACSSTEASEAAFPSASTLRSTSCPARMSFSTSVRDPLHSSSSRRNRRSHGCFGAPALFGELRLDEIPFVLVAVHGLTHSGHGKIVLTRGSVGVESVRAHLRDEVSNGDS